MFRLRRNRPVRRATAYENVLGTSLDLVISASNEGVPSAAEQAVLSEIDRLDLVFSTYRPSEFGRFLTSEGWVDVSGDLATVLAAAESWRERSGGFFLPTVEAVRLGQLGVDLRPEEPLWDVQLDHQLARRRTSLPATLNSIAKGYILDQAANVAMQIEGVTQVMVNIGGDIRHRGEGRVQAQITDPRSPAENVEPAAIIEFSNAGLASSGGYRRGEHRNGEWHSHLVDPSTGSSVQSTANASVVAPTAMDADVLATISSVLPSDEAVSQYFTEPNLAVFVITSADEYFANAAWQQACIRTLKKPLLLESR